MPVTQSESSIIRKNSAGSEFKRRRINFIEGSNVTLTVADDSANNEVDVTIAASGGSGSAAGSDTQVQFNDGGTAFGGDAGLTYNKTTDTLSATNVDSSYIVVTSSSPALDLLDTDGSKYAGIYNLDGELRIYSDNAESIRFDNDVDFQGVGSISDFNPAVDNTYDLGSSDLQWHQLYLGVDDAIAWNNHALLTHYGTTGIKVGEGAAPGVVSSYGSHDLVLQTGNATTGSITVVDGANGNINLTPNGSGKVVVSTDLEVSDEAYDATNWNGSLEVPTKNAIRDKIESMSAGSGITRTVVVTSGSATMGSSAATDYVYFVAGAHTMSLPAASGNTNRYTVKNNHSAAITIDTAGAENVEGAASLSLQPNDAVDLLSDDTNWFVV